MKPGKRARKSVAIILSLLLIFSSLGVVSAAAQPMPDVKGHWAEKEVADWTDKGYVKGYDDGLFHPDAPVTRAEFMALVNRSFGFTEKSTASFTDSSASDWSYADVQIAVKAGYIQGYDDGTVRPNNPISRQEAALIIARILQLPPVDSAPIKFSDAALIGSWSKSAVDAAAKWDLMNGYPDSTFQPTAFISRAETVVTLGRTLGKKPLSFDQAGVYGSAEGEHTISGDVTITAPDVTLRNIVIGGNLTLAKGIGNGNVTLDHVKVYGKTSVQGGGEQSVHVNNSELGEVTVNREDGAVRIVTEGDTTITRVILETPAVIESNDNASEPAIRDVVISDALGNNSTVKLIGNFGSVTVNADGITIIVEGKIENLNVTQPVAIQLGEGSTVATLTLDAPVTVTGTGTIDKAVMTDKANGSTFEKQPGTIEHSDGATPTPSPSSGPSATPTPTPTPTPDNGGYVPSPGTVTGYVYASSDQAALGGVTVSVYSGVYGPSSVATATYTTGDTGAYKFTLYPGTYDLLLTKPGYVTSIIKGKSVGDGQSVTVATYELSTSIVTGVVKDTSGAAVEGATVKATVSGTVYDANTDANGRFLLKDLPEGDYDSVTVSKSTYEATLPSFTVTTGEQTDVGTITLDMAGPTLESAVVDDTDTGKIRLVFDEALNDNATLTSSMFTIAIDGATGTHPDNVAIDTVGDASNKTVLLTFDTPLTITSDSIIKLSIEADAVEDLSGNGIDEVDDFVVDHS